MFPFPRGVPAVLEAAREPLEAALDGANTANSLLGLAAPGLPLKVRPLLPPQPGRLVSLLDRPPKVALPVAFEQRPACEGCVSRLLAKCRQVPREMGGPSWHDADGVVGHQAASPLLGHAHRARVLLPQLGHGLGRDQIGW